MLDHVPDGGEMTALVGEGLFGVWRELCAAIEEKYDMERIWSPGGKKWTYEYKYRRGGKTLCALYAKEKRIGFMVIFGSGERESFEAVRDGFSEETRRVYDEAITYRDGKWVMFEPEDVSRLDDYIRLLAIKRRPNRKLASDL